MTCYYCEKDGKNWKGDDPQCAFPNGTFTRDNWMCATMRRLRRIAYANAGQPTDEYGTFKLRVFSNSFALIPFVDTDVEDARAIVLTWYKDRGRVGRAVVVCDDAMPQGLTFEQAQKAIEQWEREGKQ